MTKRAKKSKIPIYRLENSIEDWSRIQDIWNLFYLKKKPTFLQLPFWPYKTVTLLYFPTMRAMNRQDENVGLYTHTNKDLHFSGLEIYEWRYTHMCSKPRCCRPVRVNKVRGKKKWKKNLFFSQLFSSVWKETHAPLILSSSLDDFKNI